MNKSNSLEIDKTNLTEQTKFRLDEISKIENYFQEEINQRKMCSKKLSKYVAAFDYIDKSLTVLGASFCLSVFHFVYECPWSTSQTSKCKFYANFFFNNRNSKKIAEHNKKQKENA